MEIKPTDLTIKNILESKFYKIPRFQRPYSWEKTNVEDFWEDTITSSDHDFFIGSFVLYPESKNSDTYLIVDGQQRLTTVTLLLAAVRNELMKLGHEQLAAGIQKRIEREDIDNNKQYVLQTETSYPYLQEFIQKFGEPEVPEELGSEEKSIRDAFDLLSEKVRSVISAVDLNASISKTKKSATKKKSLIEMRDRILNLQLILVHLNNENDAYLIFETLNTRGKNLGISDLLKNHLTRSMPKKNKGVDVALDKWNKVRSTIEDSAADLDIDRFIYHAWLSRYPYIGQAKLFREIRKTVKRSNAASYLEDLSSDVQTYRTVLEPDAHAWPPQQRKIANSLRALNLFRVLQPVPMNIAIVRSLFDKRINVGQASRVLKALENFHAQFTAVTSQRTGGGTARMYASSAELLNQATNKDESQEVLKEFIEKLRERVPSDDEFAANVGNLVYVSDNTRSKPLVQYLLRRIDEHLQSAVVPDYSAMTIEHILPENPADGTVEPSEVIGALGNLILVPESLNDKLGNKAFMAKRKILQGSNVPMDQILAKTKTWDAEKISERTTFLSELLFNEILKV